MRFAADSGLWPLTLSYYCSQDGWAGRWLCCYNTSCAGLPGVNCAAEMSCSITHLQRRVQLYNDHKPVTGQQKGMGRTNPSKGFPLPPGEYQISKLWEWDVWFSENWAILSLLWLPGCEVTGNLIFAGNAVLHSALAVEKLGNWQNWSINNGSGPGNNLVSKTIWTYLFSWHISFSESERRQKKKMLVDYLYTNLKNHNFWAYKYFFCEFLGLLNISGNICPCKYPIYYIRLKGKCSWWTDFLTGLSSHLALKFYHLPRETRKIE